MRQHQLPNFKPAAATRAFFAAALGLALFLTTVTPKAHAGQTVFWTQTGSGTWDTTSNNWSTGAASGTFANGDAVVFGLKPDGTKTNTGYTVTVDPNGVLIGPQAYGSGTNPGMIVGSGSWKFTGGAISSGTAQGTIQITGSSTVEFDRYSDNSGYIYAGRSFAQQRFLINDSTPFTLLSSDSTTLLFTSSTMTGGSGGAIYSGSNSDLKLSSSGTAGEFSFVANHADQKGGAIYSGGNVTLAGAGPNYVFSFTNNSAGEQGGAIYTTGNLVMSGSGARFNFVANSATANPASSAAYIGGTMSLGENTTLYGEGGFAAQNFNFTNATLMTNQTTVGTGTLTFTTIDASGNAVATSDKINFNNVTILGSYGGIATNPGSAINITGTLTASNATGGQSASTGGTEISANLVGDGEFLKTGSFAVSLTGTNTYTGSTTIHMGTLIGNIPDNGSLTIYSGATYQSGSLAASRNIATLNGAGTVDMSGRILNVTAGDFGAGTIRNASAVNKAGAGTFVIGGGTIANLNITEGKLDIGANKLLNVTGTTHIVAGSTLGINISNTTSLNTGVLDSDTGSFIDISSYGTLTISDTKTYVLVTATTDIARNYTLTQNGAALNTAPTEDRFLYIVDTSTNSKEIAVNMGLVWTGTAPASAHGTFTVNSGTFILDNGLVNNTATAAHLYGWDGKTLTKKGAGSLVLNGTNTYTGETLVNEGALYNNGLITGNVVTSQTAGVTGMVINTGTINGNINNAGIFVHQHLTTVETTEHIETTGTIVTTTTTGTIVSTSTTYTTSTTYISNTTFTPGVLNGNIANTGTFYFDVNDDYVFSGTLSGNAGTLYKVNSGTVTFDGANTYTGNIEIYDGSLKAGKAHILDSTATYTITSTHATLDLGGYDQNLKNVINNGILRFGPDQPASGAPYATYASATMANYSGTTGRIAIRSDYSTGKADRITITGSATGDHTILISNKNSINMTGDQLKALPSIPLIYVSSNTNVASATFSGSAEIGIALLTVHRGEPGSTLSPDPNMWYLAATDKLSNTADAILATVSVSGLEWHYQLDSVRQRMGDLRQEALMAPPDKRQSPLAYSTVTSKGGNAWLRANAYHLDAENEITGDPFDEDVGGINFGIDKTYRWEAHQYLLGVFADISRVERTFETRGNGDTDSFGMGFYFSYLHDNGWYGDATLKITRNAYNITANSIDSFVNTADYKNIAWGTSLEVGRVKKSKKTGWWWEGSGQAALAVIGGKTYYTSNDIEVKMADANIVQFRAALRAGRDIPNSRFRPYIKAALVEVKTWGGRVRAGTTYFTPDMDGLRTEAGLGTSFVFDEKSQLYLDYEYAKASSYERPWSVNIGYRCTW